MDTIKNIVSGMMERMSSGSGALKDIQKAWVRISKDSGSQVADLKDGAITVLADSSMRLVRLNLHRDSFLKELKKDFPTVKKINFKVGRTT